MQEGDVAAKGIVLASSPQGEYGRRLTVLTDQFGKITVFAQAAAKPKSHLLGLTRPLTCAEFLLSRGKNVWNLHGAKLIASFAGLTADFERSCYGMYVLELLSLFSQEGMEEGEAKKLLNLTYLALTALNDGRYRQNDAADSGRSGTDDNQQMPDGERTFSNGGRQVSEECGNLLSEHEANELIRSLFELRLLVIEGEYTELPLHPVPDMAAALWQHAAGARLSELFSEALPERIAAGTTPEAFRQSADAFCREVRTLFKRLVPYKFKSLEVLQEEG